MCNKMKLICILKIQIYLGIGRIVTIDQEKSTVHQ